MWGRRRSTSHAFAQAEQELTSPGHDAGWRRWAELVPDPARGRLLRLAEMSAAEAA